MAVRWRQLFAFGDRHGDRHHQHRGQVTGFGDRHRLTLWLAAKPVPTR
jgi:hypothetical protein